MCYLSAVIPGNSFGQWLIITLIAHSANFHQLSVFLPDSIELLKFLQNPVGLIFITVIHIEHILVFDNYLFSLLYNKYCKHLVDHFLKLTKSCVYVKLHYSLKLFLHVNMFEFDIPRFACTFKHIFGVMTNAASCILF